LTEFSLGDFPVAVAALLAHVSPDRVFPNVGLVVIALASVSRTRVEQIVGRVTRAAPGKSVGRVLDYGGHGERFGSFMFDYTEAIEFDRRAKREKRNVEIKAALREGRTSMLTIRSDVFADFEQGKIELLAFFAEERRARSDDRAYVLLTVATSAGILEPYWLPSHEYNIGKTLSFLASLKYDTTKNVCRSTG
jgi:hypothetical protein